MFIFIGENLPLVPWNESRHIPADSLQEALKNYLDAYDRHSVIVYFETACRKNITMYTPVRPDTASIIPMYYGDEEDPYIMLYTDKESCKQEGYTLYPIRVRAFLRGLHHNQSAIAGVILNPDDTPFLISWGHIKTCISSNHYRVD